MRVLFLLFIVVPILEMVLLIKVGGVIGALPTIALVCLTAAVGVSLIRAQGVSAMQSAQRKMATGELPAKEMLDGVSLLVGGAMLLTPGFFTDTVGFALLVPAFRRALFHGLVAKALSSGRVVGGFSMGGQPFGAQNDNSNVIQGEYQREDERN